MTIRTIVAAVALENGDEPVIHRASRISQEHGARLLLVHVIESLPATADLPLPADEETVSRVLVADATQALERLVPASGVRAEIKVDFGRADQVIERFARDHAADLLIIGPGKPQNLREKLFGSTVDRLVRSSPCPVLVVKQQADDGYRRVIAAIDFSPMSFAAAQSAVRMAPNAAMELVHVLEIPLAFMQAMRKAGTSQAEIDQYRRAKSQAALKKLRLACVSFSIPKESKIRVVHGDAAATLIGLARGGETDLVTLGVQGRNAVSKMILGSVARRVVSLSPCDILLTREPF